MNADERIVHYALGRVFAPREDVDLAARILRAWERGEPGTGTLPGREREPRSAPVPLAPAFPQSSRVWLPRSAAALIAAAGLAGLAYWATRPSESKAAVARCDGPLAGFDAPRDPELCALAGGERVAVPALHPVALELAAGGELRAWPGTVFALAEGGAEGAAIEVELGGGTLSIAIPARSGARSAAPLWVDAGFAALAVDPGGWVVVHVEGDDPRSPERSPAELARGAELSRRLAVEVRAGAARLRTPKGELALGELGSFVLSSVSGEASLTEIESDEIAALLMDPAKWPDAARGGGTGARNLAPPAGPGLFAYLDERPTRWLLLARVLDETLSREPPAYVEGLLWRLVDEPHPRALTAARALFRMHPEAFTAEHYLALAERGAVEFERELAALAEGLGNEEPPLALAVWLARRGDGRGSAALARAAESEVTTPGTAVACLQAGLALAGEGRAEAPDAPPDAPPDALVLAEERVARAGLAALEAGELERARVMAAALDFLDAEQRLGRPAPIAGLFAAVARHAADAGLGDRGDAALRGILEAHVRQ